jgi:Lipid A 3-O-deacylase (PagL)
LRNTILWMSLALVSVVSYVGPVTAQELSDRQSFSIDGTFAPDSSHIFIGVAQQRRTWTAGFEYARTIWAGQSARLDYEGSVSPFFQERDPTIVGAYATINGEITPIPVAIGRVIAPGSGLLGYIQQFSPPVPFYGIYSSEKTYAFSASPVGARINGFQSHRLQPTFSVDLGFVLSARDLPIDDSAKFNYLFSFGPGFEFFYRPSDSFRLEYLYRHMSNAGSGDLNPGVDQGVFRLTLSHHRK